jgi:biopolymer transport protein ExbD
MRKKRLIRFRRRRKKTEVGELDITSLLDILVILLVFLLKSYSTSGLIYTPPDQIELPSSESKSKGNMAVMIQVSKEKIWVDEKIIINKSVDQIKLSSKDGKTIVVLFDELTRKRQEIDVINKTSPAGNKFSGVINLVIDKTIKFSQVKNILYTAAEAGFIKYKFVVLGQE